jgi:hypothetical protein
MAHKRSGLLAQIEADVVDNRVPLSSLLQKCIVLGGLLVQWAGRSGQAVA